MTTQYFTLLKEVRALIYFTKQLGTRVIRGNASHYYLLVDI